MSSTENFDGLCGIIAEFASSGNQIRCHYELGHHGPCSFKKYRNHLRGYAGAISSPDPERGFIESVIYHNDDDK
jgi:hypothetical protein